MIYHDLNVGPITSMTWFKNRLVVATPSRVCIFKKIEDTFRLCKDLPLAVTSFINYDEVLVARILLEEKLHVIKINEVGDVAYFTLPGNIYKILSAGNRIAYFKDEEFCVAPVTNPSTVYTCISCKRIGHKASELNLFFANGIFYATKQEYNGMVLIPLDPRLGDPVNTYINGIYSEHVVKGKISLLRSSLSGFYSWWQFKGNQFQEIKFTHGIPMNCFVTGSNEKIFFYDRSTNNCYLYSDYMTPFCFTAFPKTFRNFAVDYDSNCYALDDRNTLLEVNMQPYS